jgi:3-hydroxyisobutyrate dehydrogenase
MMKSASFKFSRFYSTKPKIGFIGLGNMGSRMAPHLITKGAASRLFVYDLNQTALTEIKAKGAEICTNTKSVVDNSDIVITMLPASKHVHQVFNEVTPREGQLFIDASTIDPQTVKTIHSTVSKKGAQLIDAPVSGGVGGAEAGTLTFMVGGSTSEFEKARSLALQFMGKNIVHCGGISMGQVAKISNNLLLAISMTAVSEAMLLGTKMGMDPKILANIINTSSGRCWSSDTYNPFPGVLPGVPSSRGYTGGFAGKLMLKDVGLALTAAKQIGLNLPLGTLTSDLYTQMTNKKEFEEKDFSAILEFLKN